MKTHLIVLSFLFSINLSFSQKTITGTVTDNYGEALPDVSVFVKGTKKSTKTTINGKYSISVPKNSRILIFSYIGMKTVEKEITSDTINVKMVPSEYYLEEIVTTDI
ncbi:MAG: hypothetical protein GXO49_07290, partial [Chlorobi bacterium]|nr:hypothetical protein [Chlorobiota bacterium]